MHSQYVGTAEKILTEAERQEWSVKRRQEIEQKLNEASLLFDLLYNILDDLDRLMANTKATWVAKPKREITPYSRLKNDEKAEVVAEFLAGKSARKIAAERNRSVFTITNCLKKAGVARTVPRGLIRNVAD